jgi:DNA polymerase (family 10)
MDNRTLAARLANKANSLEKDHANLFRIRAYRRAAETILGLDYPAAAVIEKEGRAKLAQLPGIGRRLSRTIEQLVRGVD